MAFPKRVDANQKTITKLFRDMGASVLITSSIGKGAPDLIVGLRSRNILVELKDGTKVASQRNLTPLEDSFHKSWKGDIRIISTEQEAIDLINSIS